MDLNRDAKYGYRHKQVRKRLAIEIARGGVNCSRCGLPIRPTDPFDLGHIDGTNEHSGPEHRKCNRGTAGNGAANTNGRYRRGDPNPNQATNLSRDW
jgi:hypothetical protein